MYLFQEACRKLLFSDGVRTALVMISLLTLFPVGIISIVFWILVSTQSFFNLPFVLLQNIKY